MPSLSQKLFAWGNDRTEGMRNRVLGADKQQLLSKAKGSVIEIGMGNGGNVQFYPHGVSIVGIEPNAAMHKYIDRNRQKYGVDVTISDSSAEALPIASDSVDTVVTTHVLCSVRDVQASLGEILRILKPGGEYLFIEHVAAKRGTALRVIQNMARGVHSAVFAGCQCNREIWNDIETAGFATVELTHKDLRTFLAHVTPHIVGSARK